MATNTKKGLIWAGALATITILSYSYWQHTTLYPSTEDAYVGANVISVAAQVGGQITKVHASDFAFVTKGQLLAEIDPAPYQIAVEQAKAKVTEIEQQINAGKSALKAAEATVHKADSNLELQRKNAGRIEKLIAKNLDSTASGELATTALRSAEADKTAAINKLREAELKLGSTDGSNAQLRMAKAALKQAKLNLSHTQIVANADGFLNHFTLRTGSTVNPGQPLFALIESDTTWVQANFKETQLTRLKVNQPVTISCDMYPGIKWQGHIVSISRGSGAAFSVLPPENATGNWVKVTQRFPVRISVDSDDTEHPLRIGASTTVKVDTHSKSNA